MTQEQWKEMVVKIKSARRDLDSVLQKLKPSTSREVSLSATKLQESIMWLGMELKRLNTLPESENPFPPSESEIKSLETLAKEAYTRYRAHTGGVSLVSGHEIPVWENLGKNIQEAWVSAVNQPKGNPYPESYNPDNTRIEPTADGLKL